MFELIKLQTRDLRKQIQNNIKLCTKLTRIIHV